MEFRKIGPWFAVRFLRLEPGCRTTGLETGLKPVNPLLCLRIILLIGICPPFKGQKGLGFV
jgi:hypothetical protein